ncbi:MAG: phosphatidate cytidylyltransferase [Bacteroidales bacterium]|nr:MAG: phosphatidate cytidylyltransferase [Bacteroidales bacterium]
MSNFIKRLITAALSIILITGSLLLGKYTYGLVVFAVNLIALFEFFNIISVRNLNPGKYTGIFLGSVLFISSFLISSNVISNKFYLALIPLAVLVFIFEIFRNKPDPLINIAVTFLGIIYISFPLSVINYLVFYPGNISGYTYSVLLGYLVLIWTNDTSAYIFGVTVGKHKLFKRISPKKTWEGFIGGTIITIAVAYLIPGLFSSLNRVDMLVFGGIISIFGVAGDLSESMFKRSMNLKDTGKMLPGHGGILDRIDSVLLTSPLVFLYLVLYK